MSNGTDRAAPPEDPRDPLLARAYREAAGEEPPRALDDAIRAAAHRAVRARPEALGGSNGSVAASRRPRWQAPLAIAATLALAVGVAIKVHDAGEAEIETPRPAAKPDTPPPASGPAAAPESRTPPAAESDSAAPGRAKDEAAPSVTGPQSSASESAPARAEAEAARPAPIERDALARRAVPPRPPPPMQDRATVGSERPSLQAEVKSGDQRARSDESEAREGKRTRAKGALERQAPADAEPLREQRTMPSHEAVAPRAYLESPQAGATSEAQRNSRGVVGAAIPPPAAAPPAESSVGSPRMLAVPAQRPSPPADARSADRAATAEDPRVSQERAAEMQDSRIARQIRITPSPPEAASGRPEAAARALPEAPGAAPRTSVASAEAVALANRLGNDPPGAWIDAMRDLVRQGNTRDAAEVLKRFRERFPAYPIPEDLRDLPPE